MSLNLKNVELITPFYVSALVIRIWTNHPGRQKVFETDTIRKVQCSFAASSLPSMLF